MLRAGQTAVLFDVFGHRWTMRIVWELRACALNFRELRTKCDDMSPTTLNLRLAQLRELKVVDAEGDGYVLTPAGHELITAMKPLMKWADVHLQQ